MMFSMMHLQTITSRILAVVAALLILLLLAGRQISAMVPVDPAEVQTVVGSPIELSVQPSEIVLDGPRSMQQIIVTGHYDGGKVRDLTPFCQVRSENDGIVSVQPSGFLTGKKSGETRLIVQAGGKTVRTPVTAQNLDETDPVSFRHDVIAAISVAGCNSGACHGTPSGKGGFRLSLRGYDPAEDYLQLTRDVMGRRTNRRDAKASLMWLKPTGQVPHQGGIRFAEDSIPAQTIFNWLKEGLQDDPADLPELTSLQIIPGDRVQYAPARWQQLAVLAHFSDGTVRDVTRLTVFSSSDNAVAEVSKHGLVEFHEAGEVAVLCRYLERLETVRLVYLEPKDDFVWKNPPEHNYVDRHVFHKLKMLNLQPSELCTDEEFVRRAYLDVCAILPSPKEVEAFLADKDKDKRAKLIDRLLQRPEYADFWTMKWMDVLRGSRRKLSLNGVKAYQGWMRNHIQKNTPFDRVVRELLTAKGRSYQNGAANYFYATTEPEELAETTAQLFFGVRMQCAKCHNHPFEKWSQDDYYSTAAFFAQVEVKTTKNKKPDTRKPTEVIVSLDNNGQVRHLRTGEVMAPKFLGDVAPKIDKNEDRREVFAEWLTAKDNPFFAKSVVNRIWYHLLGKGIVDPVDDFRDSNPPANAELLNALAKDFVDHNFDVKHIIRTIMNSRTYQLSAVSNEWNNEDDKYFSKTITKLLTAEQLLDAICIATDVPENYAGMPKGTRATQLPDGDINHAFLKSFGQPARELACECERGNEASLAQALQLLNGKTVHEKLTAPNNRIGKLMAKKMADRDIMKELYLATLSRSPTDREYQVVLQYVERAADKRKAWEDILWTLLNTKEFMFRH